MSYYFRLMFGRMAAEELDSLAWNLNNLAKTKRTELPAPPDWLLKAGVGSRILNAVNAEFPTSHPVSIDEVLSRTESEWLRCPNLGRKSLNELKAVLAQYGRSLTFL